MFVILSEFTWRQDILAQIAVACEEDPMLPAQRVITHDTRSNWMIERVARISSILHFSFISAHLLP